MGFILIPLSLIGLTLLGLTFLISLPLYYLLGRYTKFDSLGDNTQAAIVLIPSLSLGAFLTLQIWLNFNIPLV